MQPFKATWPHLSLQIAFADATRGAEFRRELADIRDVLRMLREWVGRVHEHLVLLGYDVFWTMLMLLRPLK